jgi:hypothetical protein
VSPSARADRQEDRLVGVKPWRNDGVHLLGEPVALRADRLSKGGDLNEEVDVLGYPVDGFKERRQSLRDLACPAYLGVVWPGLWIIQDGRCIRQFGPLGGNIKAAPGVLAASP